MKKNTETISVTDLKTHALRLLAETAETGKRFVITKNGKPIAQVVPMRDENASVIGCMKGFAQITGDIVKFDTTAEWKMLRR